METSIFDLMVMTNMERGIRPRTSTASLLLSHTDMEDGTGPCWKWIFDQIEASTEHFFIG